MKNSFMFLAKKGQILSCVRPDHETHYVRTTQIEGSQTLVALVDGPNFEEVPVPTLEILCYNFNYRLVFSTF